MSALNKFNVCISIVIAALLYIVDLPWLTRMQQVPLAITIAVMVFTSSIATIMKYSELLKGQPITPLVCLYSLTAYSLVLLLISDNPNSPLPALVGVLTIMTFLTTLVRLMCIDDFNDY